MDSDLLHSTIEEKGVKQILVLDTNVVIHHIDAFESSDMANIMIVLSQTLLSEARKLNSSIFKRLTSLLSDVNKYFVFYPNELSLNTFNPRYDYFDI